MATQAQVTANRANAQHSTGPRTGDGKAICAKNAIKHGFHTKAFIIRDDEREAFEALQRGLRDTYMPMDTTAEDLFHQLLHASWNLQRLQRMENEIFFSCDDPFADATIVAKLELLRRHSARFERSWHRAHSALVKHMNHVWSLSALPIQFQEQIPRVIDAKLFQHVHHNKWKLYTKEDFLTDEEREEERKKKGLRPTPVPRVLKTF